jgi:uncharacterized protein YwqG
MSPAIVLTELQARLAQLCADHLQPSGAALVEGFARPAIRLRHSDEPTLSHLGGPAFLTHGAEWPRWGSKPLALLAVIDLEELAGFTADVPLPTGGVLNFFYEADEQQAWGFEPSHRDGWRVVFAERDTGASTPAVDGSLAFPSIGLVPEQILSIPGWEEPAVNSIFPPHRPKPKSKLEDLRTRRTREDEDRRRQAYFDLQDAWYAVAGVEESPNHQIGGWPRLQQNPIWKECDVVSRGLPLGTSHQWNDPRVAALADTQSDWRLLLQLDTDDDAGWMWGDVGTLYYAVRDSVRRPDAFGEAWMVFQCG